MLHCRSSNGNMFRVTTELIISLVEYTDRNHYRCVAESRRAFDNSIVGSVEQSALFRVRGTCSQIALRLCDTWTCIIDLWFQIRKLLTVLSWKTAASHTFFLVQYVDFLVVGCPYCMNKEFSLASSVAQCHQCKMLTRHKVVNKQKIAVLGFCSFLWFLLDPLGPLWPVLGIFAQIVVLLIVLYWDRYRRMTKPKRGGFVFDEIDGDSTGKLRNF